MPRLTSEQRTRREEYLKAVERAKEINDQLYFAYESFRYVTDPNEMEACILEITALKSKYNNLIRIIKSLYI